ncbi:Zf-UBP-domain-containing protein [Coleophoma cylindrospora]|uniref:Zf-UBP-domain-containing protein n=1 Tax=Coleophoma cylindrospora TaxID=1849047 RepID=A0A3D8SRX0_9HELO|nr:Zf-UBP-domain-containing protein [Coleophoma cylindrospora]
MPSYFYHLRFELYPYADPTRSSPRHPKPAWVPSPETDLFTADLPRHPPVDTSPIRATAKREHPLVDIAESAVQRQNISSVIDCGPARAPGTDEFTAILTTPKIIAADASADPYKAIKDWRYGPIRIESVDMGPVRPTHRRGESSAGHKGINAGLEAPAARGTKARFENLEGKNTELGWGIVHLYRDGEETPSLGREVEVYSSLQPHNGLEIAAAESGSVEDKEDCTILCIPAVPSYLTPSDFLGFVGEKTMEEVMAFRMVMTGRMNRYMVLMKFRDGNVAKKWRKEWDGKVFNSMEPETCHVIFVKSITLQTPQSTQPTNTSFPELSHDPFTPSSASSFLKPFPPPTPNLVELPTCPVCLERMDDTTGLLTILCQHVFHCACLQKWRGTGCPVCRHTNPSLALPASNSPSSYQYDPANPPFGSGEASLCSVCDCSEDLWICLICGNVGCGRYKGGHAKEHFKDSAHNFALEIETQHVWDYVGDTWVHRLIRNKGDGKVVELPSSNRLQREDGSHEDMEMVPREKLENIGMEYTHLLTSQLESQRVYFEDLLSKAAAKASLATTAREAAEAAASEATTALQALQVTQSQLSTQTLPDLERDLAREKKRAEKSTDLARALSQSLTEEKKVSEGLLKRIEHVNASMMGLSKELSNVKEENEDLKEQNRDLLFSITATEKVKELEGAEGLEEGEVEGGTIGVVEKKARGKGKGKGKGK